jgi:hypothetical protein
MSGTDFLRRKDAAFYLRTRYGIGSFQSLAKLAMTGDGPVFRKCGRCVLYAPHDLDEWMQTRLSVPLRSTASENRCVTRTPDRSIPADAPACRRVDLDALLSANQHHIPKRQATRRDDRRAREFAASSVSSTEVSDSE